MLLTLFSLIVFLASYKSYTDSSAFYKKDSTLAQLQPFFILVKTIGIPIAIYLYKSVGINALIGVMAVAELYFLFILFLRPFNSKVDYVRGLLIEFTYSYIFMSRFRLARKIIP